MTLTLNTEVAQFPPDTCPVCANDVEHEPIELVGYEYPLVQIGYGCPAGHLWFTRWPLEANASLPVVVRCTECDGLLRSPRGGSGHRPLCSRSA